MRAAGDLLGKRYRLEDRIASGGMGEVWKATDEVLGRTVAVKVLHPRMFADPGFGARFRTEARVMAALRHPGVVDVYDYGENGGEGGTPIAYLVMAYVDSEPLSERISAAGTLEPAETMAIVAQTARALRAAHSAGVVHRDVKPGNLLIRPDGHVVLVDFGVARSSDATSAALTGVNEVVGTALYMAPEQVAKRPITPATDIYALGAVAYHCLAGAPPFPGDNALTVAMRHLDEEPPALPDEIPEAVRALVIRAMSKEPEERYPTAAAMAEAAERAGGGKVGRRAAGLTPLGGAAPTLSRATTTLPRPAAGAAAVPAGATALTEEPPVTTRASAPAGGGPTGPAGRTGPSAGSPRSPGCCCSRWRRSPRRWRSATRWAVPIRRAAAHRAPTPPPWRRRRGRRRRSRRSRRAPVSRRSARRGGATTRSPVARCARPVGPASRPVGPWCPRPTRRR